MMTIDLNGKTFQLLGKEMLITDYLDACVQELYENRLFVFDTTQLAEGIYPMPVAEERSFGPGECIMDGKQMEHVRIDADFRVQIIRPPVISDYEVATRGRVIRLAPVNIRDIVLNTSFVTLND